MMYTRNKIYDLLPAIYRQRDLENGSALKALLEIIADQVKILEQDIERLYDNWFIETCDEWVVPYIADLLKAKILFPVSSATYSQRAWVANTIGYRRRKGTLSMLESMARDVTGWDSKVVEFFGRLITTQNVNHPRPTNLATPDLRRTDGLDLLCPTAFGSISHSIDVRHIDKKRGYYNIPNIGIFLWRLQSLPVFNAPAYCHGNGKFTFNQLGYDQPLFNHHSPLPDRPLSFTSTMHKCASKIPAEQANINAAIKRGALYNLPAAYYYDNESSNNGVGVGNSDTRRPEERNKSIQIRVNGVIKNINDIIVGDLTNWIHRPPRGKVAIDPELGRILFPFNETIDSVVVSYYYGFSSTIGGGFYDRPYYFYDTDDENKFLKYNISKNMPDIGGGGSASAVLYPTIYDALKQWIRDGRKNAVFEILDSDFYVYDEQCNFGFELPSNTKVIFKSSQQQRPILRLKNPIRIRGEKDSSIIFDGLIFDISQNDHGNGNNDYNNNNNSSNILFNVLPGDLGGLFLNQCTLVPARRNNDNKNQGASNDDLQFLFSWTNLSTNTLDMDRITNFIHDNFEILKWIEGANVKFEFLSSTVLKISHSTNVSDPFITIVMEDNSNPSPEGVSDSKAELRINYTVDINNGSCITKSQVLYDFVVRKKNGEVLVYVPKVSLLMAAAVGVGNNNNNNNNNNSYKHNNDNLTISLQSSICGRIVITSSEAAVHSSNSIIDGKSSNNSALWCYKCRAENSTILGNVNITIMELANNTIFLDTLIVKRRQLGCIRYCYLSLNSQTPKRYHCQPEYFNSTRSLSENNNAMSLNIVPSFTSINYGDPGYAQLSKNISEAIFRGADNLSEIGVFNNLYQPQRIDNLNSSLEEYLRFGLESGIFMES